MPRTIDAIFALAQPDDTAGISECPYNWNAGDHDVQRTIGNVIPIAFMMIYEGAPMPNVSAADLETAREAAAEDTAGDDEQAAYAEARVMRNLTLNWGVYANAFMVLVACHQVRALSQSNVDNFCEMYSLMKAPARLLKFISYFANSMEPLVADDNVTDRFETNLFFIYHTSASAAPALMTQAISETNGLGIFSPAEIAIVRAARAAPDNMELARAIPELTLVKGHAVLAAAGSLPEEWPMGDKAVKKFSAKKYTALKKFVSRIFAIDSNVEDLDDQDRTTVLNNVAALLASFAPVDAGVGVAPAGP